MRWRQVVGVITIEESSLAFLRISVIAGIVMGGVAWTQKM
jgi:hypothetical protein